MQGPERHGESYAAGFRGSQGRSDIEIDSGSGWIVRLV